MLGSTIERLDIPPNLVAHVTGRSSIGRRGLLVHVSAGLCDPGWEGQVTLELVNLSPAPVRIEPGTRVCQATFTEIKAPSPETTANGRTRIIRVRPDPSAVGTRDRFNQHWRSVGVTVG